MFNNLLKFSSIVDEEGLNLLVKWLIKPVNQIVPKFKASPHRFMLSKYFDQCGDLQNTIIVAKTTKGKVLGGYTPLSFNPLPHQQTSKYDLQDVRDESNSSFLFSLSQKQKFELIQKDQIAIQRSKDKSCILFRGTLMLVNQSQIRHKYWTSAIDLGRKYYNTLEYGNNKQSYLKITGQENMRFQTEQWQVYQVFFK